MSGNVTSLVGRFFFKAVNWHRPKQWLRIVRHLQCGKDTLHEFKRHSVAGKKRLLNGTHREVKGGRNVQVGAAEHYLLGRDHLFVDAFAWQKLFKFCDRLWEDENLLLDLQVDEMFSVSSQVENEGPVPEASSEAKSKGVQMIWPTNFFPSKDLTLKAITRLLSSEEEAIQRYMFVSRTNLTL